MKKDVIQIKVMMQFIPLYPNIRMGDGFLDELQKPLAPKEYVSNESRLIHGKRVIVKNTKFQAVSHTLTFILCGSSPQMLKAVKKTFYDYLYKGEVCLFIPYLNEQYNLIYNGKSISYAESADHCTCKIAVGFDEPDPSNRQREVS